MRTATLVSAGLLLSAGLTTAAVPGEMPTAGTLVAGLEEHFRGVQDYQCVMESEVRGEKKSAHGTYRIWYRKPELFRLKVLKGSHEGSEFAVTPSGKIRARPGGLLKKLVVKEFSKTDSRFLTPRGNYAWQSTFTAQCRELKQRLAAAQKCRVQPAPQAPGQMQIDFVYRPADRDEAIREIWTIDPSRDLLMEQEIFEGSRRVEHVRFRDYEENVGLNERFFKL